MNRSCEPVRRGRRALTLIETALVISIASGALALALPSLKNAREAAKLQSCISNLGQVTKAFIAYTHNKQAIPLFAIDQDDDGSAEGWCNWAYGGWSGTHRNEWESQWSSYNIQTRERPLSVFMTAWDIPEEVNRFTPTQEMPVFKCPSDSFSGQWLWGDWPNNEIDPCKYPWDRPAYEDVGTSYQSNWQWWWQVYDDHPSDGWETYDKYGNEIFQRYMNKEADRFVMLFEDPVDMALNFLDPDNPGVQLLGFHGEYSKHVAGFADGRAEYKYMDTRHVHDSSPPPARHNEYSNPGGWSVCDWQNDHPSGGRHN